MVHRILRPDGVYEAAEVGEGAVERELPSLAAGLVPADLVDQVVVHLVIFLVALDDVDVFKRLLDGLALGDDQGVGGLMAHNHSVRIIEGKQLLRDGAMA